jgi:hypothetical protein
MNEKTKTLIAKRYLGEVLANDFSDWAVSCIEEGIESKNILILASIINPQSFYEVEDYFRRSLNDLGWKFPNKEDSLFEYAKTIAKQILDKNIDPFEGVTIIKKIYHALDYPKGLSNWDYITLWEEEFSDEVLKNAIIREAQNLADFDGTFDQLREKEFSGPYFEPTVITQVSNKVRNNESFVSKIWRKIF